MGTRRALVFASGSRYAVLVLQTAAALFVAHHLRPEESGVAVLGNGALIVAGAVRDLGSTNYLIQQARLSQVQIRSAFTLGLIVTVLVAGLLLAAAAPVAAFYDDARLAGYLRVMTLGFAAGPFVLPVTALLARDMAFGRLALMDLISGLAYAVLAIALVQSGFGFMAVAWAFVARGGAGLLLGLWLQRDWSIFRPSLGDWRGVLRFGIHSSLTAMVYNLGEALLYLALGKILDARAVGLVQRSYLITQIPERVLLAGVGAVSLPAFSDLARRGEPIAPAYLYSVTLVAPIYLVAMLMQVALAQPLVLLLLGPQWLDAIPLVAIFAAGHLLGFAGILNITALIGAGGIRQTTPIALIQMAVTIGAVVLAAPHGLQAIAWTGFITVPAGAITSLLFLRTHVVFPWRGLLAAVVPGAAAMLASMIGPALVAGTTDWLHARPLLGLSVSVAVGGVAWVLVLALFRHPLLHEGLGAVRLVLRPTSAKERT